MSHGVKLTIPGQIDHMKGQGISFSIIGEHEASEYLSKNNNYFKLRAYRKNYNKNGNDKYVGLEFAYLKDIAIIDMRLRYCLLEMCLDVEHMIRVNIIKAIVESDSEDGYSVVSDFQSENIDLYNSILESAAKSPYCADLQEKYKDKMPIWAFVEMLQFSHLCGLYRFIADRLDNKEMRDEFYMFQEIRQLRNACAHSNCILNDLKSNPQPKYRPNLKVVHSLSQVHSISQGVRKRKLSNDRIRQIITLLYLYSYYIESNGLKKHRSAVLHEVVFRRYSEHTDYYRSAEPIETTFDFLQKAIDFWYPTEYNIAIEQKP